MVVYTFSDARILSEMIARILPVPRFHLEKVDEINESLRLFESNPIIPVCIKILSARVNFSGHGLSHAIKVAIDAGAIIFVERQDAGEIDGIERAVGLAHIAGILHDIERSSNDHARQGAEEARKILREFELSDKERRAVADAIGNHEAFQPPVLLADPGAQLLSDALYDADKFRWGPDNFTEMVWDMSETMNTSIENLLDHFPAGLKSLERIIDTFRTSTGRQYGPDFIALGLKIGTQLYKELKGKPLRNSRTQA